MNVTTQRYDGFRTSSNLQETILNPSTVSASTFGQLWNYPVDGYVFAQPLYVQNVNVAGVGLRNVLYVVTMHDVVYAFDADRPGAPLWTVDLRNAAAGVTPYLSANFSNPKWLAPIGDAFGIQSTPVINLSNNLMYVVAQTSEPSGIVYRLHAFDIRSGAEPMAPTVIQAASQGITFNSQWHCQRPALALSSGQIYIGFGGRPDDDGTYYGWLMTYNAASLAQTGVFLVDATSFGGAIWQGGGGPATDENGNVYAVSGNGFGNGDGVTNFSQSIMKFSFANGQLSLVDWFTPGNSAYLDANDFDLSTNGPMVIPGAGLVATGGKTTDFYMSSTASLGKTTADDSGAVQKFHIGTGTTAQFGQANLTTGFALWPQAAGSILYAWPGRDYAYSYTLSGKQFSPAATGTSQSVSAPGPSMVLTANGTQSGSGILWAAMSLVPQGYTAGNPGVLRALHAGNLTELWNSNLNPARDGISANAKYAVPTVVNGRVYVPTFGGVIQVYGLLASQDFALSATPLTVAPGSSGSSTITSTAANGFNAAVTYSASGIPVGVTVSFNPGSTTGTGQAVASISVNSSVAGGSTYPIVISGTSGNLTHSTTLQLTIPAHAATAVSISAPANGATFVTGSGIAITALASAAAGATVSQVTFLQGTSVLGILSASPYTFTWPNAAVGTYQLTARVTDSLGGTATSTPITVIVSPPVSISVSPTAGTLTPGQTQQFTATVGNTSNKGVTWSAPSIGTMSASGVYTAPASITAQQSVTITVTSTADATKTASATVTLVPQPDFALTAAPATVNVTLGGSATSQITVSAFNGFTASPSYSVSGLPANVTASFSTGSSSGSTLTLTAASNAVAGTYSLTVMGTAGALTRSTPLSLTLVAAGAGFVNVSLANVYNVYGIYSDGNPTAHGALDGLGDAYSANLLGSSLTAMGASFTFGSPGMANAVSSATISLPAGNFANLTILGTGNNGSGFPQSATNRRQLNETFVVTYTDGSTTTFTQSLSDWAAPQSFAGETIVSTMAYTINPPGGKASGPWYLYGYSFPLNSSKTVKSFTLPNDRGVAVLAMTLINPVAATAVNLTSIANVNGISKDGSRPTNGGLDNDGYAYSSNLLGGSVNAWGTTFSLGTPGSLDAVYGRSVSLPAGNFSSLKFLAVGVNGNQVNQVFTVTYTDGTRSTFTQSLSDWATTTTYTGQSVVITSAYRVGPTGAADLGPFHIYGYSLALDSRKTAKSLTLPNTRNVVVLGISLQ